MYLLLLAAAALVGAAAGVLLVYSTDLPEVSDLERYRPSAITEVYDDRGRVIGSFALQRRVIAHYQDFPGVLRDAVVSVEDKQFESHWGVNLYRILGAAWADLKERAVVQGASTLTMQLARNLFLSPERTVRRKIQEAILAIQIERRFTKPQIFTLYANQIFLGHGVYGFEAGARYYFGKPARELELEEAALLAALPKAPMYFSPINHPDRAIARRNLVLDAMLEDGRVSLEEAVRARNAPLRLNVQPPGETPAPHYLEEIRQYLEQKYGSRPVHEGRLRVYTGLNLELQQAATLAVLDGLAAYGRRHGWQGVLENILDEGAQLSTFRHPEWQQGLAPGNYAHGLVMEVSAQQAEISLGKYRSRLTSADIEWTGKRSPDQLLRPGDLVWGKVLSLSDDDARFHLEQEPQAEAALVLLDNVSGDIKAMVGGRDFRRSQFNHAVQAQRQPGSSFKPYVYAFAIENGAAPNDIIFDEPTVFQTESGPYIPRNYDGKYLGAITLGRALAQSRNVPTVRLAQRLKISRLVDYTRRFGITTRIPTFLSTALGAGEVTLLEQTVAYATFPNDGVRPVPRYIRRVTDSEGWPLEENFVQVNDSVKPQVARTMTTMLREVVLSGTAARAASLGYPLGGKTGTTNDYTDAWFIGFAPSLTCGVWVGFDEKKTLGPGETGSRAALPIWMDMMRVALRGHEGEEFPSGPLPDRPQPEQRGEVAREGGPETLP